MAGNGVLDPEQADEREVLLLAKGILLGWENFERTTASRWIHPFKVVTETLTAFPQLRREILFMARMDDNFRADRTEANAKVSQKTHRGHPSSPQDGWPGSHDHSRRSRTRAPDPGIHSKRATALVL
jgi:hypothetical protein